MSNFYNSIKPLSAPRSKFNLSYDHKTTCDMGQLIPIGNWICYPGDKVKISNKAVIRTQPLLAPVLHRVKIKVDAFFVPFRLIWDEWETFITGGKDGSSAPEIPLWDDYYKKNTTVPKYSLWDYMARNTEAANSSIKDPDKNFVPNDLLRRAYNFIYNNYFINRNVQNDVPLNNNDILFRNFKNDYFVSALPFQQRGVAPAIAVSFNDTPIVFDKDVDIVSKGSSWFKAIDLDSNTKPYASVHTKSNQYRSSVGENVSRSVADSFDFMGESVNNAGAPINLDRNDLDGKRVRFGVKNSSSLPSASGRVWYNPDGTLADVGLTQEWNYVGLKSDNSNASSTIDAQQLRMLMQTQKYLERNARCGSRYTEQLLGRWRVFAGDARLDRPEHIYSTTNYLVVDEIPQTSEDGTTPQGTLKGKGVVAMLNPNVGRYTCKEHGCIIQLLSIVPDLSYIIQGYDRETLWKNRYQTYSPEFAFISEQPIKKGELYFSGNPANDNALFGYEPAWSEMRHRRNVVSADMKNSLAYWHLARVFANQPSLNGDFIKIDGTDAFMKRIFATGTTTPGFIVDFANEFYALRELPKYGEPGLVDHF